MIRVSCLLPPVGLRGPQGPEGREQYYFDIFQPEYNIIKFASLGELCKHRGKKVEVFDTFNKEVVVCSSLREVGRRLGYVHSTILKVLKQQDEEGVIKLINQRYRIKYI